MWSPWALILDRAVERDLDLRPHRILDLKSYRLCDRAGTLLIACLRSSSPVHEWEAASARGCPLTSEREPEGPPSRVPDLDRAVGMRIRERRIRLGLTQSQLGELIGVTYQQAHKYETGIDPLPANVLSRIAQALDAPAAAFSPDSDPGSAPPTAP
jgi:DNA-binding XRE family transcriptional regulator